MGDTPHQSGAWGQGRDPERRRIGVLGRSSTILVMVAPFTLRPW
ncbi:hypothetical protein [Streptomyces sp. NPDC056527]